MNEYAQVFLSASLVVFVVLPSFAQDDGVPILNPRDGKSAPELNPRPKQEPPPSVEWQVGDDFLEQANGVYGKSPNVRQIGNDRVISTSGEFSNVPGRVVTDSRGKKYKVW